VTNKCTGKCHVKEEEIVPVNSVEQAKFDRLKLQIDCLENTIKWQWDNLAALSGLLKNINIKII
jgi:hypothetical protein